MSFSNQRLRHKAIAISAGVVCHSLFLAAVSLMALNLYTGLAFGLMRDMPPWWNAFLTLQFPVLHSFLLSKSGRRVLAGLLPRYLVPPSTSRALTTTLFASVASLQLIATFLLWDPSGVVIWEAHGYIRAIVSALFVVSWGLLLRSMWDAGIEVQTGFLGWSSVLRGKEPKYPRFATHGMFRFCRQPIYLSFGFILWLGPVLTLDKLLLATFWSMYLAAAPLLKERRFLEFYGDEFRAYQQRVPYLIPSVLTVADSLRSLFLSSN